MAVLDTLQILIEADSHGLETQLKRSADTVKTFIDKVNGQQANWQKVLAGSLDPAIINGIASSFALAITQAMSFQSSMMNLGNSTAGTSSVLDAATGSISGGLVNAANQAGASLNTTNNAFQMLAKQIGASAATQQFTGQIGLLASELGTNLGELMPQIVELFDQWGVNSVPAAEAALTGLTESLGKGKFTFSELLDTISKQGPLLQSRTNISDLALQLQSLSNSSTLSKGTILNDFEAISNSVADPLSKMNLLAGTGKAFTGPDGLITAMGKLTDFLGKSGIAAQTFGSEFGLSASSVKENASTSSSEIQKVKDSTDKMRIALTNLNDYLTAHESIQTKFGQDWSEIMSSLTQRVGVPVLDALLKGIDNVNAAMKGSVSWKDFFESIPSGISQTAQGLASAGFNAEVFVGKGLQGFGQGIQGLITDSLGLSGASKLGGSNHAPQTSSNATNLGGVTINNNISVAGGAPVSGGTAGQSIGTDLYHQFMGLLAKL